MKKIGEEKIEEAIMFLVQKMQGVRQESGEVLKSVRIAMYLDNLGYDSNIVISALLHEVIESGYVKKEEIGNIFGNNVLNLIIALTANYTIKNKFERDKEIFKCCLDFGREVLIIKSAELLDESKYFHVSEDREKWLYLMGKMKFFNNMSNELIRNEKPWKDVNERYELLKSTFI